MWNFDIGEALSLTVIGLAAVFFVLFLILTLTLLLKRVLPPAKGSSVPSESPQEEARSERNEKELAAVVAVAATLALDEQGSVQPPPVQSDMMPGSTWRRYGREQAMNSLGRRSWRK